MMHRHGTISQHEDDRKNHSTDRISKQKRCARRLQNRGRMGVAFMVVLNCFSLGRTASAFSNSRTSLLEKNPIRSSVRLRDSSTFVYEEDGDDDDDDDGDDLHNDPNHGPLHEIAEEIKSPEAFLQETQRMVELQQSQINQLIKVLGTRVANDDQIQRQGGESGVRQRRRRTPTHPSDQNTLKVMLFIDGTWMYYSIFKRALQTSLNFKQLGARWSKQYYIDWKMIPRIIVDALERQIARGNLLETGGKRQQPDIEITRASVYTSLKADTPKESHRYQMFQEMINAKFDVNMRETIGPSEKCIDIQLAVDLVHYATVPDSYDIAVVLTGDKDFLPAMIRTRQQSRQVALASMRSGCHRDLQSSKLNKDYEVIWLEDYMDKLICERVNASPLNIGKEGVSEFALFKIMHDFIAVSGLDNVYSRDAGKHLKSLNIGKWNIAEEIKNNFGGLHSFLSRSNIFVLTASHRQMTDHGFWIGLSNTASTLMADAQVRAQITAEEKDFFDTYDLQALRNIPNVYYYTMTTEQTPPEKSSRPRHSRELLSIPQRPAAKIPQQPAPLPEELTRDYTQFTVVALKDYCRERGLKISGKKADLLERIGKDIEDQRAELIKASVANRVSAAVATPGDREKVGKYLHSLIEEYLQARGGKASARDVGRYLAANKASQYRMAQRTGGASALDELKDIYNGLLKFINGSEQFVATNDDPSMVIFASTKADVAAQA